MITLKSKREVDKMDIAGSALAQIFEELRDIVKPGITTHEIDQYVERRTKEMGGVCEEIGFEGYQFATCTSTNDEICHGFPEKDRILKNGDICSVDSVLSIDGYFADSCYTYAVGEIQPEVQRLLEVTKKCLYLGIEQARPGNRIGDIGHAIQTYAESQGFGVVRDFIGHGIQPTMHEEPGIPHYGQAGRGRRLKEGMTICIEPMITMGGYECYMYDNGWTAATVDGSWCAQYEHTLAITDSRPKILTMERPDAIDEKIGLDQFDIDYNFPKEA